MPMPCRCGPQSAPEGEEAPGRPQGPCAAPQTPYQEEGPGGASDCPASSPGPQGHLQPRYAVLRAVLVIDPLRGRHPSPHHTFSPATLGASVSPDPQKPAWGAAGVLLGAGGHTGGGPGLMKEAAGWHLLFTDVNTGAL